MQVVEEGPEGSHSSSAEDSGVMVAYADEEFVARGQAQAQYAVPVDMPIAEVDKSTILDQVTRNTIERAIWHAQQKSKAEEERLVDGANSKGDIYENMTLSELVQERISMKVLLLPLSLPLVDPPIATVALALAITLRLAFVLIVAPALALTLSLTFTLTLAATLAATLACSFDEGHELHGRGAGA